MTSEPRDAEFDRYAHAYTDLVRTGIRASGEEPAFFAAMKARWMARWLGPKAAATPLALLDFGCGVGNSIPHLREAFPAARLHGVDPSGESVRLAADTHPYASFSVSGEASTSLAAEGFDVVQVACVFHHIRPPQRLAWMQELRRVMKPGAHLFVFEHNVLNPLTVWAVKRSPVDEDAVLLPRRELLDLARHAGFSEIAARYIVFFPHALARLRPLEPWMGWIPFGAQYVVHAIA